MSTANTDNQQLLNMFGWSEDAWSQIQVLDVAADAQACAEAVADAWTGDSGSVLSDLASQGGIEAAVSLMLCGSERSRQVAALICASTFLELRVDAIRKATRYKKKEILETASDIDDLSMSGNLEEASARSVEALSNLVESLGATKTKNRRSGKLTGPAEDLRTDTAVLLRAFAQ